MNPANAQRKTWPSADSASDVARLGRHDGHFSSSLLDARALDELLDEFESHWQPSVAALLQFATERGLNDATHPLSELVRADIDRRYSAQQDVDLHNYMQVFPALASDLQALLNIAYEDYRARQSRRLRLEPQRWDWIAGVQTQAWYRELAGEPCGPTDSARPSLPSIPRGAGDDDEPLVGRPFGDFKLICLLGTGAFSKVFLALQTTLANRHVAIKVVRRPLAEPVHMARMQHTGIVPLFSFHRIGEYSVLCMPYAGATTLSDWLQTSIPVISGSERNGQSFVETVEALQERVTTNAYRADRQVPTLTGSSGGELVATSSADSNSSDERDALTQWNKTGTRPLHLLRELDAVSFSLWFAQRVAAALAHAHARGIVHGDLKPANILVRNDGEPALIDFNLSRNQGDIEVEFCGGTLPYMAPEQLRSLIGRQAVVTPESDIYAFGTVIYEMIEGGLPFPSPRSAAESDLLLTLAARQTAKLHWSKQHATAGLQAIVTKCLHADPTERYSDASKLLEDLDAEKRNLPLQHAPEPFFRSRLKKAVQRYPRIASGTLVLSVCAVMLSIAATFGLSWWHQSQQTARAVVASLDQRVHLDLPELIDTDSSRLTKQLRENEATLQATIGDLNRLSEADFYGWLNNDERSQVAALVFDHSLVTASLMLERANRLDSEVLSELQSLLARCEQFPDLTSQSTLLAFFKSKVGFEKNYVAPGATEEPLQGKGSGLGRRGLERVDSESVRPVETILDARILLAVGDAAGALKRLTSLTQIPSHELLFWLTLGQSQLRLGQAPAARLSFTVAIRLAPTSAVCYAHRAEACMAMRDGEGALADYTLAIELDPKNVNYYASRAFVHEQRHELPEAIKDLSEALVHMPGSNRLLLIRYRLQQDLGNFDAASEDFRLALRQQPRTVSDWISRGLAHARSSPGQALLDLQQANQLKPGDPDVLQNMAYVQSELLGDLPAAIESLDKILAEHPLHEMARGGRCVLHARLNQPVEALHDIS